MSKRLEEEFCWTLEDGTVVSPFELADEIALVPRTKYWRLSHIVLLWPESADPQNEADEDGFADGFALELLPVKDGIEWLLQPTGVDETARITGVEPNGRQAILAAFSELNAIQAQRLKRRMQNAQTKEATKA